MIRSHQNFRSNSDSRSRTTFIIWGCATGMLALCIPLVGITTVAVIVANAKLKSEGRTRKFRAFATILDNSITAFHHRHRRKDSCVELSFLSIAHLTESSLDQQATKPTL
jgi:hypothetical protein